MSGKHVCWLIVKPLEVLGPAARRMLPLMNQCRRVGDSLTLYRVGDNPNESIVTAVKKSSPQYVVAHGSWCSQNWGEAKVVRFSHRSHEFGGTLEQYVLNPSAENAGELMSILALEYSGRHLQTFPHPFASHVCWHVLVLSADSDEAILNGQPIREVNCISVESSLLAAQETKSTGALWFVSYLVSNIAHFQELRAHTINRRVSTCIETELRSQSFLHALLRRNPMAIRSALETDIVIVDLALGDTRNSPHELLRHEGIHVLRVLREIRPDLPIAVRDNRSERPDQELLSSLATALGCTVLFSNTDRDAPNWYDVLRRSYSWSWLVEQEALATALAGPLFG